MDLDDQFDLGHILLNERKCRVCGEVKDLIDGFYLTRKTRGDIPSAYSLSLIHISEPTRPY